MTQWEVTSCAIRVHADQYTLKKLLAERWEPFAVTESITGHSVYHLRRPVTL